MAETVRAGTARNDNRTYGKRQDDPSDGASQGSGMGSRSRREVSGRYDEPSRERGMAQSPGMEAPSPILATCSRLAERVGPNESPTSSQASIYRATTGHLPYRSLDDLDRRVNLHDGSRRALETVSGSVYPRTLGEDFASGLRSASRFRTPGSVLTSLASVPIQDRGREGLRTNGRNEWCQPKASSGHCLATTAPYLPSRQSSNGITSDLTSKERKVIG